MGSVTVPNANPARFRRFRGRGVAGRILAALLLVAGAVPVQAAKIGEITDNRILDQATRFLTFQDPAIRLAVGGAVLMGVACGILEPSWWCAVWRWWATR